MGRIAKAARAGLRADRKLTHRAAAHREAGAVKLAGALSEAADQPPLLLLGAMTIVAGAVLRRPTVVRTGVRMLSSEIVVDRTRPETAIKTGKHRFEPGGSDVHAQNSFPSGHTAGAVAVAGAVAHEMPGAALPAYATAVAVGAVQMPRGKHYVLDTLAGAAIGYVAEAATGVMMRTGERVVLPTLRRFVARTMAARR